MIYLIQIIRLFKGNSDAIEGLRSWIETIDTEYDAQEFVEYLDDVYGIEIPESGQDRFKQLIMDRSRVNATINMFVA